METVKNFIVKNYKTILAGLVGLFLLYWVIFILTPKSTMLERDRKQIDALNEKIEAGLFAIAKYTQDTANRLERWDYGDRMVVRVEQDATDVIKVKTV